ncbi:MAG TPA: tyrosine/phenylalanine carboxypeptidase domain-containing protein [Labilithrix sp.]|nr:tyrosine/phenylalanine carboxypeptidase domain-containing protein [Labilithrix sp.]
MNAAEAKAALSSVAKALEALNSKTNLLDDVAWPREAEERFFADGASKLPVVTYAIDRATLGKEIEVLRVVERRIEGEGPIVRWLRGTMASYIDRARLLLAVGTREFGSLSREVYGSAKTSFFGLPLCNLDLARHLAERLSMHGWDAVPDADDPSLDAQEMVTFLETRIAKRKVPVKVVLDPSCTSKAIAGMKRVRVRPDATFTAWEAEGLYRHEVETHAYSALNGADQEHAAFLKSGGPRATPTQEGLAVFAELYHHALAVPRLRRLALRVEMVAMAEDGASFLDVYRFLTASHGMAPRDAYLDAARIFRGGLLEGGAPFTKDACYLAGLVEVRAFLATFVRAGFRDECEMLVCGRFALDDIAALVELRAMGILTRPRWRPRWLRDWGTLLPYFAFSSFTDGIDLVPVEARYADAIRIASAATARSAR